MSTKGKETNGVGGDGVNAEKTKQLNYIASIVRALITSRKPPVTLTNVMYDYPQVEGRPLPYQMMGYKSPEELLTATGEFFFNRIGNNVIITSKYNSKSAHIQNMVRKQKDTRIRNRSRPKRAHAKPRQPSRSRGSGKHFFEHSSGYNAQKRLTVTIPNVMPVDMKKTESAVTNKVVYNNKDDNNNNKNNIMNTQKVRPILGQNNNNTSIEYETLATQRQMAKVAQHKQNSELLRKINSSSVTKVSTKMSVQDRLKLKIDNGDNKINTDIITTTTPGTPETPTATNSFSSNSSTTNSEVSNDMEKLFPPKIFQFNKDLDSRKSLEQYCIIRGYDPPEFSVVESKFSHKVYGRVTVNDKVYSTYPEEAANEEHAILMSAKKAIELIELNETRRILPECTDTDSELVNKIFKKLLSHPHGLFARSLPEWFEDEYKQHIPENWWTLVQTSNKFLTEKAANNDNVIVFANKNNKDDLITSTESTVSELPEIKLPWNERYWYLTISACISTTDVYARLIGPDYSESFDVLMNAVDRHMLEFAKHPFSIELNEYYLIKINDFWHRVRAMEMEEISETVLVYFIDIGEIEWMDFNCLYVCEKRFLLLPAQAVCFSLFGVEDFAGFPNVRNLLEDILLNKPLVSESLTKELEYFAEDAVVASSNKKKIQIVLYDTSTEEDINMNHLLQTEICKNISKPKIDADGGVVKVIVRNINDNGNISVNLLNGDVDYIEKLIEQLITTKFNKTKHLVNRTDIKQSDLFLVCDDSKPLQPNTWHRATIVGKQEKYDIFSMLYVDEGGIHSTHISNIFRLESLSTALCKYPHQAITVYLDNIPDINSLILGRMRALLPIDKDALIKISVDDKVRPLVYMYRRADENSTLCTINDVIRLEHDLEHKDEENTSKSTSLSNRLIKRSLSSPSRTILPKFNSMSVNDSPKQTLNNLPKLENFTNFPKINQYIDVRIVMSANPTNFKLQCFKECKRLDALMVKLQEYCKNSKHEVIPHELLEVGQAYAAKNPDGFYHRAIVEKITDVGKMLCVYYCDYGDMAIVLNNNIKLLPAAFRELPKMAIQTKLYGIAPMNGDWTKDDCIRFRELTVGKKFVAQIMKITSDGPRRTDHVLEVDLVDVSTDEDIYIRQVFINEKRAIDTASPTEQKNK